MLKDQLKLETHHRLLGDGGGDVGQCLEGLLVVGLHHVLQHVHVLEDGEPELGHALDVLLALLLLLILFGL